MVLQLAVWQATSIPAAHIYQPLSYVVCMGTALRPVTAIALLVVVVGIALSGAFAVTETVGDPYDPEGDTVALEDDDRELWLYTSQARSFDRYTLALNVLVYGPPEETERRLTEGQWEEIDEEKQDFAPDRDDDPLEEDPTPWDEADGATRYVYLTGGDDQESVWLTEAYQLHDGAYLGSRHHVRAYTPPDDGNWTALQGHAEYWDWFSARHIVTSVEESQSHVETTFVEEERTLVKTRVGGEDRSDFDGWITIVDPRDGEPLPAALGLFVIVGVGAVTNRIGGTRAAVESAARSEGARAFAVAGALVGTFMAVRFVAIWLEGLLPIAPNLIAGLLYPVIFIGLPVIAYLGSRQLQPGWAVTASALGFGTATLLDFTVLGVTALPLSVFVHRGGLAVALGLIAVGAARVYREQRDRRIDYLQLGVLLWIVASVQPLFRFTPIPV